MKTLIRNASVVLPNETGMFDVLIENDRIAGIGTGLPVSADEVIDARGLHLIPGCDR